MARSIHVRNRPEPPTRHSTPRRLGPQRLTYSKKSHQATSRAPAADASNGPHRADDEAVGSLRANMQHASVGAPSAHHANPRGILVTATSANHFAQLHGLVQSAQLHLPPRWHIVVYDLLGDLSEANVANIRSWCGTEYRRFDPARVESTWNGGKYLTLSVWKPLIISDCLRELPPNGIVFYADTSTRLHEPLSAELIAAVRRAGCRTPRPRRRV